MKHYILLFLFLATSVLSHGKTWIVNSPDKTTAMAVTLSDKGELSYVVSYKKGKEVSGNRLGFILKGGENLTLGWKYKRESTATVNEKWQPLWGENNSVADQHSGLTVNLVKRHYALTLECRVFSKGVGFRYKLTSTKNDSILIADEQSRFTIAKDAVAWWIPVDYDSYEKIYRKSAVSEVDSAQTPFTIRCKDGQHIAIHEAALVDYASMTLRNEGNGTFVSALVPWPDGVKVRAKGTVTTPWRTIIIGDNAADIANSTLIVNLNERANPAQFSWVKPQKYVGIWWEMHLGISTWSYGPKHGATTRNAKRYIDFAAANGFQSVLVEGWNRGWEQWRDWSYVEAYPDYNMKEVMEYARSKGVTIIVHNETAGYVDEYNKAIPETYDLYKSEGAKIIKTGYVGPIKNGQHHQGQWMVNHLRYVVSEAAKRGLCVVAHEVVKPTGLQVTWPNLLACESARGQEYNAPWAPENNTVSHTLILPFTRLVGGPMDYTPGLAEMTYEKFGSKDKRSRSTQARELAHYILLYSPIQMACDLPENYADSPVLPVIRSMPTDWEQSVTLDASIGEFMVEARKQKGRNCWYVAAATDETPRVLTVHLPFIEKGKSYKVTTYSDGPDADWKHNPRSLLIESYRSDTLTSLRLRMASGGGALVIIDRE